jgi:hypothetical protein
VDYPAVRAIGVDQPVVVDSHPVTFWQAVSQDGSQYATIAQVAEVIARLHALARRSPCDCRSCSRSGMQARA